MNATNRSCLEESSLDLEERPIDFAVDIVNASDCLSDTHTHGF